MAILEYDGKRISEQFESAFAELWTKIHQLANTIQLLREKNRSLTQRNFELEEMVEVLEEKIGIHQKKNEDIVEKLTSDVDVGERLLYLTPDEREAMEHQIDELLASLKPYVG
jgi:hypothetical protein